MRLKIIFLLILIILPLNFTKADFSLIPSCNTSTPFLCKTADDCYNLYGGSAVFSADLCKSNSTIIFANDSERLDSIAQNMVYLTNYLTVFFAWFARFSIYTSILFFFLCVTYLILKKFRVI